MSTATARPLDDLLAKWSREAVQRREQAEAEAEALPQAEREAALRRLREAPDDDQPEWGGQR